MFMRAVLRVYLTWIKKLSFEYDLLELALLYRTGDAPEVDGSATILFFSKFRFKIVYRRESERVVFEE